MTGDELIPAAPVREADIRKRIDELTVAVVEMNGALAALKATAEVEGALSSQNYLNRRRSIIGALGWKQSELARLKQMVKLKERAAAEVIRNSEDGYDPEDGASLIGALIALARDLYADLGGEWSHEDAVLVDDAKAYIGRMAARNGLASDASGATA